MDIKHLPGSDCVCEVCRYDYAFKIPDELFNSLVKGDVVFFIGAGVSTETRTVYPYTLYDDVRKEVGKSVSDTLSFPDLMTVYCALPNGRANLLRKIKDRFQYIDAFPELYRSATRFHGEICTIPFVETFVTTNWDTYLEDQCGAMPLVTAEDFAFSELPGRKVFKIHGSVQSYGSIVATREDYESCYKRLETGLLGSKLKVLLATKTFVYVGFSFRDDDFLRIHKALTAEMRGLRPQAYIVTPEKTSIPSEETGLTPIRTDGTFFVSKIKEKLVSEKFMLPDEQFAGPEHFLASALHAHGNVSSIDHTKYPDVIFGLCYQDGLIHALERILSLRKTGQYSAPANIAKIAKKYEFEVRPRKLAAEKYDDVAYIDGYINGLFYLLADDSTRKHIPLYYTFGAPEYFSNLSKYKRSLSRLVKSSAKPHRWAAKVVAKSGMARDMDWHHTPFLL